MESVDFLILGGGVIGLSVGLALLKDRPDKTVLIVEKEWELGFHASGRNSGVLHAGFYYSPDSLKARFCRDGNRSIRHLAKKYGIPIKEVGKVVVASNSDEENRLDTLLDRGLRNGVDLELHEESKLADFEPLAVTHERFLWSPTTAISDPLAILKVMAKEFRQLGGRIEYGTELNLIVKNDEVIDATGKFNAHFYINAAGAQADRIARLVGVGIEYAMLPFMGVYRATEEKNLPLKRLVYPVPHTINPFLGVHFTLTTDNKVKIGPTAIPILGREQYSLFKGWSGSDISQAIKGMISLVRGNAHDFGSILKSEIPKFLESALIKESSKLVPSVKSVSSWHKKPPGIRAQLVHVPTGTLEQDFVLRKYFNSIHVLNAVSPGWTCAIPFGTHVASQVLETL